MMLLAKKEEDKLRVISHFLPFHVCERKLGTHINICESESFEVRVKVVYIALPSLSDFYLNSSTSLSVESESLDRDQALNVMW